VNDIEKILYLQHAPFEGPAHLETAAVKRGAALHGYRLYSGQPLPGMNEFDLLAVMGGPMGVYDEKKYPWLVYEKSFIEKSLRAGRKIIGICLGAQLIADVMGAPVRRNRCREIGWFPVKRHDDAAATRVGRLLPDAFHAFHWHGDTFDIPAGALRLAGSEACANQGFTYGERVLALQFHLESTAESVRALVAHCGGDLDGSEYVQREADLLAVGYIDWCNRLFEEIIEGLMQG
jgi:GMP synthase-like glutamine amidotransferase